MRDPEVHHREHRGHSGRKERVSDPDLLCRQRTIAGGDGEAERSERGVVAGGGPKGGANPPRVPMPIGQRVTEIIDVSDYSEAVGKALALLAPGELALIQALDGDIESSLAVLAAIGVVSEEKSRGGAGTANKPHPRSVPLPVTIRSSSRPDSKKN